MNLGQFLACPSYYFGREIQPPHVAALPKKTRGQIARADAKIEHPQVWLYIHQADYCIQHFVVAVEGKGAFVLDKCYRNPAPSHQRVDVDSDVVFAKLYPHLTHELAVLRWYQWRGVSIRGAGELPCLLRPRFARGEGASAARRVR